MGKYRKFKYLPRSFVSLRMTVLLGWKNTTQPTKTFQGITPSLPLPLPLQKERVIFQNILSIFKQKITKHLSGVLRDRCTPRNDMF